MMRRLLTPFVTGVLVMVFGIFVATAFHLYAIPHFDKALHVTGGLIVAWFFSIFFKKDLVGVSWFHRFLILVAMAGLVGLLWEFAEFGSSFLAPAHPILHRYFFGGDLTDTLTDLMSDLVGGMLYTLFS